VVFEGERLIAWGSKYLGPDLHTNNEAEYHGLCYLLRWAAVQHVTGMEIFCDSKLVVNQVNDEWEVNTQSLLPMWRLAIALKLRGNHTLNHVKGHSGNEGNELADWFANDALNKEGK
jgi:ribonuclease HI